MMKALIVATVPTERSMPPVSMVMRLAAGEDRERDGELDGVGDPALVDDAGAEELEHDDQREQQDDQRDDRPVAHEAPHAPAERRRGGVCRRGSCVAAPQRDAARRA